jgi:uncharacterized delta-60 repeat protein
MTLSIIDGDKLVLQGFWNNPDHSQRPVLVQLQSNGIPDAAAFASGYSLRLPNPDTTKPVVRASAFSADGHGGYLVAGQKCEGGFDVAYSACESIVGRVTATGTWDTTFGTAGAGGLGYSALVFGTTQDPALAQLFFASARDASGNLVAVGNNEGLTTGTVARFLGTTGAIDTAFGTSGRITPVLVSGATAQQFNDVVIDEDGQITAVGTANSGGPLVVVARYTATGAPDTSYGTAGVGTTTAAAHSPRALLQADGRLIVAGAMPRGASGVDVVAWRFWP